MYVAPGAPLNPSVVYNNMAETMSSVRGRRSRGMKPCEHRYSTRWSNPTTFSGLGIWVNNGDHAQGQWQVTQGCSVAAGWDAWPSVLGCPDPVQAFGYSDNPTSGLPSITGVNFLDAASMINDAMSAIIPGIRATGGLSLINSLVELKDFRSLPRTVNNLRLLLSRKSGKFSIYSLMRKNPRASIRRLLQAGADVYLQKEFNIGPLLNDICNLRATHANVRNQLAQLVDRKGKPQRRHFRRILDGFPVSDSTVSGPLTPVNTRDAYYQLSTVSFRRRVTYPTHVFCVTVEYDYSLPPTVNKDSLIPAYLDALGINLNPSIVWNAIPWSFVVDWVFGVSQWLGQFKTRNIEPQLRIRDACYSTHIQRVVKTSHTYTQENTVTELYTDYYKRDPFTPGTYRSLRGSTLSPKELSLAVALASSRL